MRPSKKLLQKIIKALAPYKPQKIILFGSAASGKWRRGSDIDLLIIKKTSKPHTERVWEIQDFLFDKVDVPVDVVVYAPEEFEWAKKIKSVFIEEILEKGKVIYG